MNLYELDNAEALDVIVELVTTSNYVTIFIIANTSKHAKSVLAELLPLLPNEIKNSNQSKIYMTNGCRIFAGIPSNAKGMAISLMYISENLNKKNSEFFYDAIFPTISAPKSARIIQRKQEKK